ncbi:DUF6443 domain-containing protein [Chitinophaga pollutisoli]|uniref:DUF6443 domain-containing protein n=1 Tax=Chitinophaga pollutisoli TaxID=3133966 RepID=A0ABZ2YKU3_9BACT
MKNLLRAICALLLLTVADATGQVPDAAPPPRLQAPLLPGAYPAGVPLNYIRTWQPTCALRDAQALQQQGKELWETKYFDGLGRAVQTVEKGKSPRRGDIVSISIPETRGGEGREYLPFTFEGGNGRFRNHAFADQYRFWSTMQPQEQVFFGSKSKDLSPDGRVRKICAPGNNWQGNGRGQSFLFPAHLKPDDVACWKTGLQEGALPVFAGMYGTGALQKEISVDENNRQLVTYKDKEGRVIMRKAPVAAVSENGHNGFACTYFIFDPLGRLRYIIPPKLVEVLAANGWKLTAVLAADLAFRFEYDARGRKVIARLPGIPETEYVYDARDRPVLQRGGNLRAAGRWMATGYDALNRPVLTGILTTALSGPALREWLGKNAILPPGNLDTLTQTFYDHYRFPGAAFLLPVEMEKVRVAGGASGDPQPASESANGKVTGMRVKVLGTNRWLLRTFRYDQKMRLCQETGMLHNGVTETITRLYNFSGKELVSRHLHGHPRSKVLQVVQTNYQYDHAGRTLSVSLRLNDNPVHQRTVAKMEYGPSGELSGKSFLRANGSVLESLQYQYNVRGWLTGINADFVQPVAAAPHYFGQTLHYDQGFSQRQFNGNIAGMQWKGSCEPVRRAYGFTYDPLDRLLVARYSQPGSTNPPNFDMILGNGADPAQAYDLNGNIRRLRHWGARGVQLSLLLDDLRYQYEGPSAGKTGNQLLGVADIVKTKAPDAGDFTDDPGASLSDYAYDLNGNMTRDRNKGIDSIRWNVLDLPEEVIVNGKGKVQYQYDAAGNKLSHSVISYSGGKAAVVRVDYLSGFVYRNDTLQFFLHGEGRARPVPGERGHRGSPGIILCATIWGASA